MEGRKCKQKKKNKINSHDANNNKIQFDDDDAKKKNEQQNTL